MQPVISIKTCIFYPLLPGKPDPKEVYELNAKNPRKRVIQKGQPGDTCWYYAMNRIRRRIGPNAPKKLQAERIIEQLVSKHRKDFSENEKKHRWKIDFAKDFSAKVPKHMPEKMRAAIILQQNGKFLCSDIRKQCLSLLQKFVSQNKYNQLLPFTTEYYEKTITEVNEKFLRLFASEKQNRLRDRIIKQFISRDVSYEILNHTSRHFLSLVMRFIVSYKLYKLKRSTWHPAQPIDRLITVIKECGPLLISGHFGEEYYQDPPIALSEKIGSNTLYGWKPNAPRTGKECFHSVVVIGARSQEGKEHVYFVDPLNPSDPINGEKIYVMSYERLRTSICNLFCSMRIHSITEERSYLPDESPKKNHFALYNPIPLV